MSDTHSAFLPPVFSGSLSTKTGASMLRARIPNGGDGDHPRLVVVNWAREPVFRSDRDARKRVALVTDEMCSTKAVKIEMVIYPAGTGAASHHQEGATSFMYVMSGRGTATTKEQSFSLAKDDLIYFPHREQRAIRAAADSEIRFLAFYVPGEFKTVWANPGDASAWRSTGLDINGYQTLNDQKDSRNMRAGGFS